ncbi:MAG TPA: T9SS type A sorting domain-containing protein [Flavobacterium sp.]|nr:T9SS type A sorting domain-containing protein [Flavobacterium sp.]
MKKIITSFLLFVSMFAFSQETLNVMSYNLFKFPTSLPQNRELILQRILDDYQPDLFMVCELVSENAADLILNTSLQNQPDIFARANFVEDLSKPEDPLQTMVFYNTRKLTLVAQQTLPTVYRDINHYSFMVNVDAENPIHLEVFVAHLKSSTGPANRQMRYDMVEAVTDELQNLTEPDTFVLFGGDFNFYNSTEIGYQQILNPENAIKLIDPIDAPGDWQDDAEFSYLHTQSTRVSNAGFGGFANAGASGGMDDRFDFIMMSENFNTSTRFSYVPDSYQAYGNNGDCLNKDVKDESCTGVFSQALRNDLYSMSDHLPVVMQIQISEPLAAPSFTENKPFLWFESTNVTDKEVIVGIDASKTSVPNMQLFVFNTLGQLVETIPVNSQSSVVLDVQKLSSGLYFIKTDAGNSTLKFIKK